MNQEETTIHLRKFMDTPEGWGRAQGREVYLRLLQFVDPRPNVTFKMSMLGVKRIHTHSFLFEDLPAALRHAREREDGAIKVVLQIGSVAAQKAA